MQADDYDLIVVGGGLVGAGLIAALAQLIVPYHPTFRMALIDAKLPSKNDPRLFALNYSSCQFLKNLNLWDAVQPFAAPIRSVHVSQRGRFGRVHLSHEEVQLPELGHVIPAKHIEAALHEQVANAKNVSVFRPATLTDLQQDETSATLTVRNESGTKTLRSPLIIGADGTASTVRTLLQIEVETTDYNQIAIVTRTELANAHGDCAYERFTPQGAIAMLPLPNQECATIWSLAKGEAEQLLQLADADFLSALQEAFGQRLGPFVGVQQRHSFPLRLVRAKKAVDRHVFLLGNALHTVHPIAAQGFNLALYEVATLVEGMVQRLKERAALTVADLVALSQETEKQQQSSIQVSHHLAELFATERIWQQQGLGIGMAIFDLCSPLKKYFLNRLLGRAGKTPRLLMNMKDT